MAAAQCGQQDKLSHPSVRQSPRQDSDTRHKARGLHIPDVSELPSIAVPNRTEREQFYPYLRDETTLARPWAVPGTPGLER